MLSYIIIYHDRILTDICYLYYKYNYSIKIIYITYQGICFKELARVGGNWQILNPQGGPAGGNSGGS